MERFIESHYFHLPSQGNIYTMKSLKMANAPYKMLVASLKREIYCLEFQDSPSGLIPTTKEVSFTYIPSGSEIISLDVYNKSLTRNDFVIGVTIIKHNTQINAFEYYLNIYSEWEESDDFNIDSIAQNCLNVELTFTPYQLTHTQLILWENDKVKSKEIVFLLSGNDNQIHVYREYTTDHLFKEIDPKDYFPELAKTPSPVTWIDVFFTPDLSHRITAQACECGYTRLTKVCVKTHKLIFNFHTKFNNYISHVALYAEKQPISLPENLLSFQPTNSEPLVLNLVVINSILPPLLFHDVLTFGLSKYVSLPRHDYTSVLTCCQVADIDFDGEMEVLVGNSAEEVVMYKRDGEKRWCLEDIRLFASPVLCMNYADVIEDGVKELVVMSMKGVHFLQHDFLSVQRALQKNVEFLTMPDISALAL